MWEVLGWRYRDVFRLGDIDVVGVKYREIR